MRVVRFQRRTTGAIALGVMDTKSSTVLSLERNNHGVPDSDEKALMSLLPEHKDRVWDAAVSTGIKYATDAEVRLLAPIANPGKIVCIGLNYRNHAVESKMAIPERPVVFAKWGNTICGHKDKIVLPNISQEVDYEVELVIVVGRGGRHIPEAKAMEHVAGFTVGNDVSARDWQIKKGGSQWNLGKTFDTFAPIGPAIRVNDDTFNAHNARLWCDVNGRRLQDSTTREFVFNVPQMVSYVSSFLELQSGDIIFTGTPPGVGFARSPPIFLRPGDNVVVGVEGIGELENVCVADRSTPTASKL
eukprot:PhM_4_TR3532/c0_g1_i1/m.48481